MLVVWGRGAIGASHTQRSADAPLQTEHGKPRSESRARRLASGARGIGVSQGVAELAGCNEGSVDLLHDLGDVTVGASVCLPHGLDEVARSCLQAPAELGSAVLGQVFSAASGVLQAEYCLLKPLRSAGEAGQAALRLSHVRRRRSLHGRLTVPLRVRVCCCSSCQCLLGLIPPLAKDLRKAASEPTSGVPVGSVSFRAQGARTAPARARPRVPDRTAAHAPTAARSRADSGGHARGVLEYQAGQGPTALQSR